MKAAASDSTPEAVPSFLTMAKDPDPRIRALVMRGLKKHIATDGVVAALVAHAADPSWQVRRGAHDALAKAPADQAVAPLKAAMEAATGPERERLQAHLASLGAEEPLSEPRATAFELPVVSSRVAIVVDWSKQSEMETGYLQREIDKLLEALPKGAMFELALVSRRPWYFQPKRSYVKVSSGVRRKVAAWLKKQEHRDELSTASLLRAGTRDYAMRGEGRKAFERAPDTIYLVAAKVGFKGLDAAIERLQFWNDACDTTFHLCSLGGGLPSELKDYVKATGGLTVTKKKD